MWPAIIRAISWIRNLRGIKPVVEWTYRFLEWFIGFLLQRWIAVRHVSHLFKICRFSLFVVLLAGLGILFTDQGREATLKVADEPSHAIFFLVGVFFWAFQSWFGSRLILERIYPRSGQSSAAIKSQVLLAEDKKLEWWVNHLPRLIAAGAYLVSTFALIIPLWQRKLTLGAGQAAVIVLNVAIGIVFYIALVQRRTLLEKWLLHRNSAARYDDASMLEGIRKTVDPFTLVYSIVLFVLAATMPALFGFFFGTLGVLFLGLSSIAAAGNFIIRRLIEAAQAEKPDDAEYAEQTGRFPVITALFGIAIAFSFINDNHDVRTSNDPPTRWMLKEAVQRWSVQAPAAADGTKPMVVIATAGGGIRAAHWTAAVLTGLTDAYPSFPNSLFAISGVSGGSVGAAFYTAMVSEGSPECTPPNSKTCWEALARRALSRDYLAPVVAGLTYTDLLQRLLPIPMLPDRARALEQGWERGWRGSYDKPRTEGLEQPFTQIWRALSQSDGKSSQSWIPMLLLNSTHMETGKRVVASPIRLEPERFDDLVDFLTLTGRDMPLSTAAHNSARFTYVSPAGTLQCADPKAGSFLQRWFCRNGHVLDGGYFENYGAVTALQLVRAMADEGLLVEHRIRPVLVLITNDPNLTCRASAKRDGQPSYRCGVGDNELRVSGKDGANASTIDLDRPFEKLPHSKGANEVRGPIKGLLSTREARGILAAKELRWWIEDCRKSAAGCKLDANAAPDFFHFRLELAHNEPQPALGWLLSDDSEALIWRKLACTPHNRQSAQDFLKLFAAEGEDVLSTTKCPS